MMMFVFVVFFVFFILYLLGLIAMPSVVMVAVITFITFIINDSVTVGTIVMVSDSTSSAHTAGENNHHDQ